MRHCWTITLLIMIVIGGAGNKLIAQEANQVDSLIPESIRKRVIYGCGEKQQKRCMVVIAHHHGDALFSGNDDIPHWIPHQNEVLDILLEFSKFHDSRKIRFFFEGEKGLYNTWPEERRAVAPQNHKAFQEWKKANAEKRKVIVADFTKELGKSLMSDGWKIWNRYDPSLGLVSYGKEKNLDAIIFGSEPPKKIPLWPDLDLFPKEDIGMFRLRLEKTVLYNIHERNRYASLVMREAVPDGGVGVLLMGAGHSSAVYKRYPKMLHYNVSGEIGLESHLAKIGEVNVIVVEPITLKSLTKKRGID